MDDSENSNTKSKPPALRLPQTVFALGVVSLLTDIAGEMIYPLLPHFFTAVLGAPTVWLGWIEGLAESTATLAKLPVGIFSDRLVRRKPLILAGYGAAGLIRPLMGFATTAWHALAIRFSDRLAKGVRGVPRDALIAEVADASIRGRAFGFHRAMDHAGAAIGPLIAFAYLSYRPDDFRTLFLASIIPGILVVLVVWLFVREPKRTVVPVAKTPMAKADWSLRAFPPGFRRLLIAIVLFSFANSSDAFLLWRVEQLGLAAKWLPILWFMLHVAKSAANVVGGRLADRISCRVLLIVGWLVYAVTYLGFGLATEIWQAAMLFFVYAIYFGLTEPSEKTLVTQLAPAALRGTAFGWFNLAVGVSALPASVGFGWLVDPKRLGPVAFDLAALFAVAAALLLWVRFPRTTPVQSNS